MTDHPNRKREVADIDEKFIENMHFEICGNSEINHISFAVDKTGDSVTFGGFKEINCLYLMAIISPPNMHLFVIVTDVTFDVFIHQHFLHSHEIPMFRVRNSHLMTHFKSLVNLSTHIETRVSQCDYQIYLLSQLTPLL
jgi:hypothetical protein